MIPIESQNMLLSLLAIGLVLIPERYYELFFQGEGQKGPVLAGGIAMAAGIYVHYLGWGFYLLSQKPH